MFMARYSMNWYEYRRTPEWVLEELASVILGESKGSQMASEAASRGSGSGRAATSGAVEIAQSSGLPVPPGGWKG